MYQYIKVMWLSISFRLLQYQTYANEHKRKWLLITWQYLTATSDLQAAPLYISSCLLLKSDVCFLGVVLVVVFSVCLSSERRQLKSPRACFVPVAHCSSGSQLRLMGRSCLFYFFPPLIFMHNGALLVCVFSCKWKWLCCFLMGRALTSPVCLRKVFVFHFHVSVKRSSTLQCVCVFCVCVCVCWQMAAPFTSSPPLTNTLCSGLRPLGIPCITLHCSKTLCWISAGFRVSSRSRIQHLCSCCRYLGTFRRSSPHVFAKWAN